MSENTLPLFDLNAAFVRTVSVREAVAMVNGGVAEPLCDGGWRDRDDAEWVGVKLSIPRDIHWSRTCLDATDARRNVAEIGEDDEIRASQLRVRYWMRCR